MTLQRPCMWTSYTWRALFDWDDLTKALYVNLLYLEGPVWLRWPYKGPVCEPLIPGGPCLIEMTLQRPCMGTSYTLRALFDWDDLTKALYGNLLYPEGLLWLSWPYKGPVCVPLIPWGPSLLEMTLQRSCMWTSYTLRALFDWDDLTKAQYVNLLYPEGPVWLRWPYKGPVWEPLIPWGPCLIEMTLQRPCMGTSYTWRALFDWDDLTKAQYVNLLYPEGPVWLRWPYKGPVCEPLIPWGPCLIEMTLQRPCMGTSYTWRALWLLKLSVSAVLLGRDPSNCILTIALPLFEVGRSHSPTYVVTTTLTARGAFLCPF